MSIDPFSILKIRTLKNNSCKTVAEHLEKMVA